MIALLTIVIFWTTSSIFSAEPPLKKIKLSEPVVEQQSTNSAPISQSRIETLKRMCSRMIVDAARCKKIPDQTASNSNLSGIELGYYHNDVLMIDPMIYRDIIALKRERVFNNIRPTTISAPYKNRLCHLTKDVATIRFVDDRVLGIAYEDNSLDLLLVDKNTLKPVLAGKKLLDVKAGTIFVQDSESQAFELYRLNDSVDDVVCLARATHPDIPWDEEDYFLSGVNYLPTADSDRFALAVQDENMIDEQLTIKETPLGDGRLSFVLHPHLLNIVMLEHSLVLTDRYKPESAGPSPRKNLNNHFALHNLDTGHVTHYPDRELIRTITTLLNDHKNNQSVFKSRVRINHGAINGNSLMVVFEVIRGYLSTFGIYDTARKSVRLLSESELFIEHKRPGYVMPGQEIIRSDRQFFSLSESGKEIFCLDDPIRKKIRVNSSRDLVAVCTNQAKNVYVHPILNKHLFLTDDQIEEVYDLLDDPESFEHYLLESTYENRIGTQDENKVA